MVVLPTLMKASWCWMTSGTVSPARSSSIAVASASSAMSVPLTRSHGRRNSRCRPELGGWIADRSRSAALLEVLVPEQKAAMGEQREHQDGPADAQTMQRLGLDHIQHKGAETDDQRAGHDFRSRTTTVSQF